jgi:hypothetical protein
MLPNAQLPPAGTVQQARQSISILNRISLCEYSVCAVTGIHPPLLAILFAEGFMSGHNERWQQLVEEANRKRNAERLLRLTQEIDRLLSKKEKLTYSVKREAA